MQTLEIGDATIHHGDSLRLLKELHGPFAAVITDPPYCSGGATLAERQRDPVTKYVQTGTKISRPTFVGDGRDARSWCHWCALWLSLCLDVLEPDGYVLMFTDWRQLPLATDAFQFAGANWRGIVPWDKTEWSRAPHTGYFRIQAEYVVWGTKGRCRKAPGRGPFPGAYRVPHVRKDKHHITGKPVALMEKLVACVEPGAAVLDPFMGSGTTGVACLNTGRKFVGMEATQANFEIAERRLRECRATGGST